MNLSHTSQTILVATLGGQPQIITFTLDLLLAHGEPIEQVILISLAGNPRCQAAYQKLSAEFLGDRYQASGQMYPCHLRSAPVRSGQTLLAEARQPDEVEAVRRTVYDLLGELKAQSATIHLSLSGGRRIIALTALAAAMQHFTPADRIWHLHTPPDFTEQARGGAVLHAPPEAGVHLIPVPFVPWTAYFPALRPLMSLATPQPAASAWQSDEERQRCQQVWQGLSRREQDLLRLAVEGLSRAESAEKLGLAISTVDSHRKKILRACRAAWPDEEVNRPGFVAQRFKPFLDALQV